MATTPSRINNADKTEKKYRINIVCLKSTLKLLFNDQGHTIFLQPLYNGIVQLILDIFYNLLFVFRIKPYGLVVSPKP